MVKGSQPPLPQLACIASIRGGRATGTLQFVEADVPYQILGALAKPPPVKECQTNAEHHSPRHGGGTKDLTSLSHNIVKRPEAFPRTSGKPQKLRVLTWNLCLR